MIRKKGAVRTKKIQPIEFRQSLFWDVDPKTINTQKHADYIIERILDLGNDKEVRWLFHYYPKHRIKKTLTNSRGVIHKKSKTLWSLVLQ